MNKKSTEKYYVSMWGAYNSQIITVPKYTKFNGLSYPDFVRDKVIFPVALELWRGCPDTKPFKVEVYQLVDEACYLERDLGLYVNKEHECSLICVVTASIDDDMFKNFEYLYFNK